MLRKWQAECAENALNKYKGNQQHFFCQATPAAGKTVLAAEVASRLLEADMIDLVLCFSPSLTVSDGIKRTFSRVLGCTFNGGLGSIGQSLTYQSIQFLNDEFWKALQNHRVFVVFDEIHHCSGSEIENANVWGQQVLTKIQDLATYTLALSGTPWRSDSLPIVMGEYTNPEGQLQVNYQYTLKEAIADNVCRIPKIVLVDNEHLTLTSNEKVESFSSIFGMISEGTDIPRLQVCCHMSSVKTELYFRQVLGRILRVNGILNQQAWLFTFAEQSLIEFSERIEQDIPESCMFAKMKDKIDPDLNDRLDLRDHKEKSDILDDRDKEDPKLFWNSSIKQKK